MLNLILLTRGFILIFKIHTVSCVFLFLPNINMLEMRISIKLFNRDFLSPGKIRHILLKAPYR